METSARKNSTGDVIVNDRQGGQGKGVDMTKRAATIQNFDFEGWKITVSKSTILPSYCYCATLSSSSTLADGPPEPEIGESSSSSSSSSSKALRCQVCRFEHEVKLKHLPEMVFPDNILRMEYQETGFVLEFNAIDAIKQISENQTESIRVAYSEEWKAAQEHKDLSSHIDYDWTFASAYRGTLQSASGTEEELCAAPTNEKLNLDKLKEREKILFYEELNLYEDELHDNGTSNLSVKLRVMPSGFFVLLRFFLRVDNVMIKLRDTRIHFETGKTYFLRETQERRQSAPALAHLPTQTFGDPNLIYQHLPVTQESTEKVTIV